MLFATSNHLNGKRGVCGVYVCSMYAASFTFTFTAVCYFDVYDVMKS